MTLTLTKRVPARTKTVTFCWIAREFRRIDDKYRAIRSKSRNPMDTCFWCRHKFVNGEMMALAARDKGSNVVLCQDCAGKMKTNQRVQAEMTVTED